MLSGKQPRIDAWAVRVSNLTKRYRDQTAVDGLSLDVPAGAVFGLLGENGAGKTTTIQALLGLIAPDDGRTEVLGLDPATQGLQVRRRVGYVPEVPGLYDWMTVKEIGWFAAGFHPDRYEGGTPYFQRYLAFAESYGLPMKRKIKALSKGMRAKVSLAVAVSSDPALLILDEPTSGLDVLVRREFLESMVETAGTGRTVLLSSHQIGEVERVASHVALLHKGRLLLAEPIDELKARSFALTVTFRESGHPAAPPEHLPVDLVDADDGPRQALWLVHARDRPACESVRSLPGVESLRVDPASLEDIYIAYMRGRRARPGGVAAPSPAFSVA